MTYVYAFLFVLGVVALLAFVIELLVWTFDLVAR